MNNDAAFTILEELLIFAMEEILTYQGHTHLNDEDRGTLMAYFNVLAQGKQEAAKAGLCFQNLELNDFDASKLPDLMLDTNEY